MASGWFERFRPSAINPDAFRIFDERQEIARPGLASLLCAHRLTDFHEAAVEDMYFRMRLA